MKLSQLQIARETVRLDATQDFEVRAVSAVDLALLMGRYGPMMAVAWARVAQAKKGGKGVSKALIQETLLQIIPEFPELFAAFIAVASDDLTQEGIESAKRLPITVQTEALIAIFALTFATESDLKKFIESLTRMGEAVAGALTRMGSSAGTGEFAATLASSGITDTGSPRDTRSA